MLWLGESAFQVVANYLGVVEVLKYKKSQINNLRNKIIFLNLEFPERQTDTKESAEHKLCFERDLRYCV